MNDQYVLFQTLWITYNDQAIYLGLSSAITLLLYTLSYNLNPDQSNNPLTLLSIRFLTLPLLKLAPSAFSVITLILTYIPSLKPLIIIVTKPYLINPLSSLTLLLAFIGYFDQSFSDSFLQEGDYLVDSLILMLVMSVAIRGSDR